jgi:hypothetical protein
MQMLPPLTPIWPEPGMPLCEQILPGNATPEPEQEEEGKIGSGGDAPGPLQGGADPSEASEETGAEGDGT